MNTRKNTLCRIGIKARVCNGEYSDLYKNWLIRYMLPTMPDIMLSDEVIADMATNMEFLEEFINYLMCSPE